MNYKIKKLLQLSTILLFAILATVYTVNAEESAVEINAINFPDAVFRSYVSAYRDKNKDNFLSKQEAEEVSIINLSGKNLNMKGIEYFTNLEDCTIRVDTDIYNLDAINALKKLTELDIYIDRNKLDICIGNPYIRNLMLRGRGVKKIDVSRATNIVNLEIENNSKKSIKLDVSQMKKLKNLEVMGKLKEIKWGQKKKTIEVINLNNYTKYKKYIKFSKFPKLKNIEVWCDKRQNKVTISDCPKLRSITISANNKGERIFLKNLPAEIGLHMQGCDVKKLSLKKVPRLVGLYAYASNLKKVNIEKYRKLEEISVSEEKGIQEISLKKLKKLKYFSWNMSKLEKVTIGKHKKMTDFSTELNKIKGTVDLSGCPKLELVSIADNKISNVKMPSKKKKLTFFDCHNNRIKELNLYNSIVDEVYAYDNPGITVYLPYKMKGDAFLLGKTKKVYYQKNKYVKN